VAFGLIPEAGFLEEAAAGFEDADMALDFVFEAFWRKAERVRFLLRLWCRILLSRGRTLTLASQRSEPSSNLRR